MAHRSARRATGYAQALLIWAEGVQGQVPHLGHIRSTSCVGDQRITSEVRVLCAGPHLSRTEYVAGPMRGVILVDDGEHSWRHDPSRKVLYAEGPSRVGRTPGWSSLRLLLRNYEPRFLGRARVAGRPVLRLALVNRFSQRVARRLWLDRDTGLMLRSEEYRPEGSLLTRTTYQEVWYGVPSYRRCDAPLCNASRVVHHEAPPILEENVPHELGFTVLRPRYAPPGFEYEGTYAARCGCDCQGILAHQRYTDGLRSISVFQCGQASAQSSGQADVPLPRGGLLRIAHGGCTFVFVGECTDEELRRMAASLP